MWEPELGTKIIAIPRSGKGQNMVFETDAFFSWHYCNGFERDGKLVIDYVWINSIPFTQDQGTGCGEAAAQDAPHDPGPGHQASH